MLNLGFVKVTNGYVKKVGYKTQINFCFVSCIKIKEEVYVSWVHLLVLTLRVPKPFKVNALRPLIVKLFYVS